MLAGAVIGQQWGLPGVAAGALVAQALHFVLAAHLGLKITGLAPKVLIAAHFRGLAFGALVGAELVSVTALARHLDAPPAVALGVSIAVLLLTALIAVRVRGGVLLGADGIWLLRNLGRRLPRRLGAVHRALGLDSGAAVGASAVTDPYRERPAR